MNKIFVGFECNFKNCKGAVDLKEKNHISKSCPVVLRHCTNSSVSGQHLFRTSYSRFSNGIDFISSKNANN
jgi:hypothetical protein